MNKKRQSLHVVFGVTVGKDYPGTVDVSLTCVLNKHIEKFSLGRVEGHFHVGGKMLILTL